MNRTEGAEGAGKMRVGSVEIYGCSFGVKISRRHGVSVVESILIGAVIEVPSSLLLLAWLSGCIVGPGAVACSVEGGGWEEALLVGFEAGVLEGYLRTADAEALERAAFEEAPPMIRNGGV